MTPSDERQLDAFAVDVRQLLEKSVASLYSHLVTRPTGRAVRMAIERQLDELPGPALSLMDLSSVAVLDYSCADEVVAKLLIRFVDGEGARDTFFLLQGVQTHHVEPIEAVLDRHDLAVVAETAPDRFELLGRVGTAEARSLWDQIEESGRVQAQEVERMRAQEELRAGLDFLLRRRLAFRHPLRGDLHALSSLAPRRDRTSSG